MKEAQVILNRLLDKFENSKHLSEPNTSRRRVMLRIDKRELPEYQYEDAVVRDAYNIAARELEQQALVRLEWARKQSVLSCIVLDLERVAQCYECADRVHPRKKAEEVANIIMQKLADNPVPWIAAWRNAVCAQVRNSMKVPTYCRENDGLLQELLYTDQLKMQLATLNDLGRKWTVRINREVQRCEDTAKNIGTLCMELKLAGGLDYNKVKGFKDKQKVTEDARAQFYFAVDQPFRQWLQAIDPERDDPDETVLRWQAQARSIAKKLGEQMVMEAGNAALKGHRIVVDKGKKTERTILYTSPRAYNIFRAKLWEIYPKAES